MSPLSRFAGLKVPFQVTLSQFGGSHFVTFESLIPFRVPRVLGGSRDQNASGTMIALSSPCPSIGDLKISPQTRDGLHKNKCCRRTPLSPSHLFQGEAHLETLIPSDHQCGEQLSKRHLGSFETGERTAASWL